MTEAVAPMEGPSLSVTDPPARKRYYRVLTPNPAFKGERFGFHFEQGECILPGDAVTYQRKGQSTQPVAVPVLPLFQTDLHYTVQEIPEGEDPLPRAHLARLQGGPA